MSTRKYLQDQTKAFLTLLVTVVLYRCSPGTEESINYLDQQPPGLTAQLFAPGLVSTNSYEHSAPAFSPDGSVVLWTVVNQSYRASMLEMKYEQGKWSTPHRPSFADSTADDYYPSFSPDGKKLYFSSRRKVPEGYPQTRDMRIWEVDRNENSWGDPLPFDTVASQGQDYAHSITRDGTVYISSSLGGGTNFNIRKSEKASDLYSKPIVLPYSINSVGYEDGPYIAPDGSFLIFESQRPEGIAGSVDLYISFRNRHGRWNLPVNMGPKVNTGGSERFARLSPDGKYLFFGSTRNQSRDNRGFDIFWIDAKVIDELRPNESEERLVLLPLGDDLIDALYRNDSETSSGLLNRWLEVHPDCLDAVVVYSSALRKLGRYSEAEELLARSASQWNEIPALTMEGALVKFGMDKDDEAVTLLTPLLVEGDQLRERYVYLSKSLLDMARFKESDEYFEKAMAIFPSSYPYFNRACTLARMGRKDDAFKALNRAVELRGLGVKEFETSTELEPLKSDPRWKVLLAKFK